jgi:alpha-D-xyloside xylohydrolase
MMRALTFDFQKDANVYSIPDQYMFGPAFLVNPVTAQLYTGAGAAGKAKTREVYLPAGTSWYNFWTGEVSNGGQKLTVDVPMDMMPLYVRAGSIVPMGPVMQYATEKPADKIELRIYPGANGSFKYYEDENDNYNYEKGAKATFTLNWNDKLQQLSISATKGSFKGMLKKHTFNIVLVKGAHGSNAGPADKIDRSVAYNGKPVVVRL